MRSWENRQEAQIYWEVQRDGQIQEYVLRPDRVFGSGAAPSATDVSNFSHLYERMRDEAMDIADGYVDSQGKFTGFTMADLDTIVAHLRYS